VRDWYAWAAMTAKIQYPSGLVCCPLDRMRATLIGNAGVGDDRSRQCAPSAEHRSRSLAY
jgi:hypothetical protein